MTNKYFEDEEIEKNDLFFMCYMIERVARKLHQTNKYVVNTIGYDNLYHLISVANVLHSENPKQVEENWIEEYKLKSVMDFIATHPGIKRKDIAIILKTASRYVKK